MDFFLCNHSNDSLFHFPTLFTFPRPFLPHTLVIIVCTNHLKILMSSRFDSVFILGIRFMVQSPLDLVESLHKQSHMGMGYWLHSRVCMDGGYRQAFWLACRLNLSILSQWDAVPNIWGAYCMETGSPGPNAPEEAEPRGSKGRAQTLLTFDPKWLPLTTLPNES